MRKLIDTIARHFHLTAADLTGDSRQRHVAEARQACCWALRRAYPALSLEAIGQLLGGRDHTTVIYSIAKAEARMRCDAAFAADMRALVTEPPRVPTRKRDQHTAMRWWATQGRADWSTPDGRPGLVLAA